MASGPDYANRLQKEIQKSLATHSKALQKEVLSLRSHFAADLKRIEDKLDALQKFDDYIAGNLLRKAFEEIRKEHESKISSLVLFAHNLRKKETQEEILAMLMDEVSGLAPRAALFAVRGDQFCGRDSRGYPNPVEKQLASCSFGLSESPILQSALEADGLVTISNTSEEEKLSEIIPVLGPWHAFPLKVIERPVAVLLAAASEKGGCELESLCILMDLAGLCIENLALKMVDELKVAEEEAAEAEVEVQEMPSAEPVTEPVAGVAEAAWEERPAVEPLREVVTPAEAEAQEIPAAEPVTEPIAEATEAGLEKMPAVEPLAEAIVETGQAALQEVQVVESVEETVEAGEGPTVQAVRAEQVFIAEAGAPAEELKKEAEETQIEEVRAEQEVPVPQVPSMVVIAKAEELPPEEIGAPSAEAAEPQIAAAETIAEIPPPEEKPVLAMVSPEASPPAPSEQATQPPPVAAGPPIVAAESPQVIAAPAPPASEMETLIDDMRALFDASGRRQAVARETPPPPPSAKPAAPIPKPPVPVALTPEEEKLHSDAKRFARLLVSEIKLYNEQRVTDGRRNHDLYIRLKKDIERSREMYERRVSPIVAKRADYFHQELVRILGDNDPTALGSGYPGSRVEG
jgi:hypothetical protein